MVMSRADVQSIVIIQNLLDILVHLDPTVPTYVGDLRRHWQYTHSYMTGGFYGLSWGIVKTIAEADMSEWDITYNRPEDARTGSLVVSTSLLFPCQHVNLYQSC